MAGSDTNMQQPRSSYQASPASATSPTSLTSSQTALSPIYGVTNIGGHGRVPKPRSSNYVQPYSSSLDLPELGPPPFHDFGQSGGSNVARSGDIPRHFSPVGGIQGQKRAYRQRRKDPSCDACRERKVKVQDLEKQLAHARQQLSQLQSQKSDSPEAGLNTRHRINSQAHRYESGPRKRLKTSSHEDFSKIGSDLVYYGHGIFKPPLSINQKRNTAASFPNLKVMDLPQLPPKQIADDLLSMYRISFHATFPLVDWNTFCQDYESAYRQGSLQRAPQIWSALFFAVLACGTLCNSLRNGKDFLDQSQKLFDHTADDFTLDHVRTALLNSVFLVELNHKSAGWIWLGVAIRMGQDIGLHHEHFKGAFMDQVVNRPVWWTTYVCDRLLSLELGRPPMINDDDCEIHLPSPAEKAGRRGPKIITSHPSSPLSAIVQIIRGISKLLKNLKESTLPYGTIQAFDLLFDDCMIALPAQHQINAREYLDPHEAPPLFYLQNARLTLHRQNLGMKNPPETRSKAIDNCNSVAKDTARLISRCMQHPPGSPTEADGQNQRKRQLISAANAFLCTHIWRCTLFLAFRAEYDIALLCAEASATLGNARPINAACGRYLDFFLQRLTIRLGEDGETDLDTDEEMLVLLSGDLQGSAENSWVWRMSEEANQGNQDSRSISINLSSFTTHDETPQWSHWDGVLSTLTHLQEQRQRMPNRVPTVPPSHAQVHLVSPISPGGSDGQASTSGRIRIADIM
ncbi:MAG: hypothetical protein Q9167_000403 [Letrouitia subvulpina]